MPVSEGRPRVAVLSHVLPPSSSGQAVVLYRLLRDWDPSSYCVLSRKDYAAENASSGDMVTARLAGAYHHLPDELQVRVLDSRIFKLARGLIGGVKKVRGLFRPAPQLVPATATATATTAPVAVSVAAPPPRASRLGRIKARGVAMLQTWDDWLNPRLQLKQRARHIETILRQEKCTALVACSGDLLDLPAGFLAAQRAGVPFYSYMFDDYEHQWTTSSAKRFGLDACRKVIGQAAGVIVPNEFLADAYRQRYGVESILVRNPVEEVPPYTPAAQAGRPFRIVYTGAIYEAHYDAFQRMMQVLTQLPAGEVEFHIYTSSSHAHLAAHGIAAPITLHPAVSNAESVAIQRSADALFLPLAFASPYPAIINTSAPGKMGEYLASNRPVLVHAPSESFLSWYCRRHDCAQVVDVPEADALRAAVLALLQQPALRQRIARNAWQRAAADFHLPAVSQRFASIFASQTSG